MGAVVYAQLEVAYSDTDFTLEIAKLSLSISREQVVIDDATSMKLDEAISKLTSSKRGMLAKAMNFLSPALPVIGYVSMLSFIAAYTLIVIYLFRLW